MIKLIIYILLFSIISCGIPTIHYVVPPETLTSTDSERKFKVNSENSLNYTVNLYARYYLILSESKEFTEVEYDNSSFSGENYLTNNGFHKVLINNNHDYPINNEQIISIFPLNNKQNFIKINSLDLPLILNYKNLVSGSYNHFIGKFDDVEGEYFINQFSAEVNSGIIIKDKLYVEYAIIAKDLDPSTVTNSESIPVYLGTLHIQGS